ncbi:hypothetical protein [Pseudomonas chlororaphis]|uniref:hypothetical protein n=1 Tax=Pseudomonas chlororaphis TaxID=587753 RepID=UPI0023675ABC|nr:hypothetical protein [Pseudomonas chlororaphis]WDG70348.1 hypothetical protein PUP65_19745 [Pseudomonas chlororaphis]
MSGISVTSGVIPVMNLHGGSRNERSITGALLSSKNNAEVNLAKVSHQDTPHTQDAAYRDLAQKACEDILGNKAHVVLKDTTEHGAQLKKHAINLFVLKKEIGESDDRSFTKALDKFNSAVQDYKDKGEKGYSSTCNVGSTSAYKANTAIEKAIDEVLKKHPGVFDTAVDMTHTMYLRDGLPKAQGLQLGLRLDEQSTVNSGFCGNATEAANSHLVNQLNHHVKEGGGAGLGRFVNAMLGQLNLGRDPEADRSNTPEGPAAGVRGDGSGAGRLARDITQTGGGARIGDIIVKPDGSSGGEIALLKALDIIGEQSRFLQSELLRVSNPNLKGQSTRTRPDDDGKVRLSSPVKHSIHRGEVDASLSHAKVDQPEILKHRAEVFDVSSMQKGEVDASLSHAKADQPEVLKHRAEVFDVSSMQKGEVDASLSHAKADQPEVLKHRAEVFDVSSMQKGEVDASLSHAKAGQPEVLKHRAEVFDVSSMQRDEVDASLSHAKADQPDNSLKHRAKLDRANTLELNPQLMPIEALRYFNIKTDGDPDLRTRFFFDQIASGIQSNKPDALALRDYIKQRHDPSKARADVVDEANIHRIYADAKKESPAFALRLEMLFSQFNERRVDIPNRNNARTDTLTLELTPQLMPKEAPRFFEEPHNGSLSYARDHWAQFFYDEMASGIQSRSPDALILRSYIKEGRDPSKALANATDRNEVEVHRIYARAKEESPAFAVRLERLFSQFNERNVAPITASPSTTDFPRLSAGSATYLTGNPKRGE